MPKRYNDEFKKKIVDLANNGKKISDIIDEYGVARSTVHKWKKDFNQSGSFKAKDNRTDEEKELLKLRKEIKQLKMENDILKQAALILGQK
jgi:transposase